jgi:hypothetical protein
MATVEQLPTVFAVKSNLPTQRTDARKLLHS